MLEKEKAKLRAERNILPKRHAGDPLRELVINQAPHTKNRTLFHASRLTLTERRYFSPRSEASNPFKAVWGIVAAAATGMALGSIFG
ncbi:hypothetical protein I4J35_10540 [Corynebacterium belfantii]|nr:hypothetical protein [Corynebacterium belfantii]